MDLFYKSTDTDEITPPPSIDTDEITPSPSEDWLSYFIYFIIAAVAGFGIYFVIRRAKEKAAK